MAHMICSFTVSAAQTPSARKWHKRFFRSIRVFEQWIFSVEQIFLIPFA